MRLAATIILTLLFIAPAGVGRASPADQGVPPLVEDHEPALGLRLRSLYANYSGADVFLPEGAASDPDENLSGDGIGADIWTSFGSVDVGLTASSAFWLNRDPSYFGGAFVGKSLSSADWRLSFGLGFGAVSLVDSSDPDSQQTKTRPATAFTSNVDYFVAQRLFVGLQVQSWVALGPEGDLGISTASLAVGYDLL